MLFLCMYLLIKRGIIVGFMFPAKKKTLLFRCPRKDKPWPDDWYGYTNSSIYPLSCSNKANAPPPSLLTSRPPLDIFNHSHLDWVLLKDFLSNHTSLIPLFPEFPLPGIYVCGVSNVSFVCRGIIKDFALKAGGGGGAEDNEKIWWLMIYQLALMSVQSSVKSYWFDQILSVPSAGHSSLTREGGVEVFRNNLMWGQNSPYHKLKEGGVEAFKTGNWPDFTAWCI